MKKVLNIVFNLFVAVCSVLVILIGIDLGFSLTGNEEEKVEFYSAIQKILPIKNYKNMIITEENYDEIMEHMKEELDKEDEVYYATYAMTYYMMQDGLTEAFSNLGDESFNESAMYSRIYGKTMKQLINEGKQLMKQENITLEQYKKSLDSFSE